MVEASKLWFEAACKDCRCHELIHPWTYRCSDATRTMLISCIKGSYKFYAMVYLIQILMRGKKLGKKEILEQFKLYLKSGIFGLTVGSSFVTLNCIFRKLFFSQFSYYTTVLLPCTVSGIAVYCEPPYRRVMVVNLFVNLVFEYWVRTLEMKGWLRRSPGKETLIFMLGSAVFFYLLRLDRENDKRTPLFWFFTPPRVSKEVGEPVTGIEGRSPACPHKGPCINYILKGTAQLFGVGYAMTLLRTIIPKILTPRKALGALRLSQLKLGLFFGGYIGLYRLVVCILCRSHGKDSAAYALPAGFLSGLAFRAAPSLPIALAPVTSALQLVVCILCRSHGKDSAAYALPAGFLSGLAFRAAPSLPIALAPVTSALQILCSWGYQKGMIPANWPLVEILYCVCQGLLFHARVMHEDVCPRYIINLMHTVTSAKADEIQSGFIQRILKDKLA